MPKNRIAMLAVSVILFFFYVFCNSYVALFAVIIMIALAAVSFAECLIVSRRITVLISKAQSHADAEKRTAEFCISAENGSVLPAGCLIISMVFSDPCDTGEIRASLKTTLAAKDKRQIYVPLSVPYAACVGCRLSGVKLCDSFGVLAVPIKISKEQVELLAAPSSKTEAIKPGAYSHPSPDSDVFSDTTKGDDRSQVFELRDYREGDDLRNVHWPLSTKRDTLTVKEFSRPIDENVRVLIETAASAELSVEEKKQLADRLLSAFMQLSLQLLENGQQFNVNIYSQTAAKNIELTVKKTEDIALLLKMALSEPLPAGNRFTYDAYYSSSHNDEAVYYIYDSSNSDSPTADKNDTVFIDVKTAKAGGDTA